MKNRKKLSAVTAFAVVAALVVPSVASAATTTVFTDIGSSYAANAIQTLANEGILTGTGNGQFSPSAHVTRQDMAIILAKALNLDVTAPPATATFSDVPTTNYSFKYVEAAVKAGVIHGQGNGVFGYGQTLSRQDMAIMLVNALKVDYSGAASNLNFTDSSKITYGQDQVGYAVKVGLVHGMGDGTFNPAGLATREQVAAITENFLNLNATGFAIKASATNVAMGTQDQLSVPGAASVEWSVSGNAVIDQMGNFVATQAGTYTVTAVANGTKTLTQTITVYGAAAAVTVTSSAATLSANTGTTTLTAKVVDANGTPVAGAVVDFYSSNNSILNVPASATTDATGTATVTATAGTTDGTATVTSTVDGTAVTNTANVVVTPVTAGQVTVLNADQIQVNFSEPVAFTGDTSATSFADDIANYSIKDSTGTTDYATSGTVAAGADGKSVVITLGTPIPNNTTVSVTATNIQSADGQRTLPLYSTSVLVNDTTAPSISSITSSTNGVAGGSVTVNFSEPTAKNGTIKIDGVELANAGVEVVGGPAVTWATDGSSVTFAAHAGQNDGLVLDPSKAHTIDAFGLTDLANPANSAVILGKSFNVTVDQAAPTVSSVTALNDHQIEVAFSKPVNSAAVEAGISVYGEDLSAPALTIDPITVDSADTTNDGTNATKYIINIPASDALYSSLTSRNLTVGFNTNGKTIADAVGNDLATTTKNVTLKEDTVAPVISGLTYNTDTNGNVTSIVAHLSKGSMAEAVNALDAALQDPTNGVKVIDVASGQDVSSSFVLSNAVVNDGDQTVTLKLATPAVFYGTYKFVLPAGLFTDNTQEANTNAATTLSVNFGSTVGTFSIAQSQVENALDGYVAGSNVVTVNFGTAVTASAINPANYTFAGKALPSDTLITLNTAQTVATITLPAGYVASDDTAALFNVKGVVNQNGVSITPFTGYAEVRDNTAPTLQTAQIIDSTHILLTFSENMLQTGGDVLATPDLTITNTGSTYTSATAANVVGHANQLMITLAGGSLNLTQATTVTTDANATVLKDASLNGNAVTSGTTVTATN